MLKFVILSIFLPISFFGCSKCPDSIDQLYKDIDPLYQVYYSNNIEEAEEALLSVVSLALEYKECGLNSIPQLLVVNYRLFHLNEYKEDSAMSKYYLVEAKKYYKMLGRPYVAKNDKSIEENLQLMFIDEIEGQDVPMWIRNRQPIGDQTKE